MQFRYLKQSNKFLAIRTCFTLWKSKCICSTDKRTDAWWDIFMILKIDFGLLAVGLASLWKKRFGQIMSNFWGRFFQLFVGKKKKKWKHCSLHTEKFYRKKVKKKFVVDFFFFFKKNQFFRTKNATDREQTTVGYTVVCSLVLVKFNIESLLVTHLHTEKAFLSPFWPILVNKKVFGSIKLLYRSGKNHNKVNFRL